jgi:hypothetical protein
MCLSAIIHPQFQTTICVQILSYIFIFSRLVCSKLPSSIKALKIITRSVGRQLDTAVIFGIPAQTGCPKRSQLLAFCRDLSIV